MAEIDLCIENSIDSNITGLSIAEEECLKKLPDNPIWYGLEPNSYSDFGGEITTVARSPIDPSRQNKKGTITDLSADGGFNIDVTKSNLNNVLQGFFFADAHELATTTPLSGERITISSVDSTDNGYNITAATEFTEGMLMLASGFNNPQNNGLKIIIDASASFIEVSETLVSENTPPSGAKLEQVGLKFDTGAAKIVMTGSIPKLEFTTTVPLNPSIFFPGAWIFIGSDSINNRFDSNVGFARIKSVDLGTIIFDDTTFTPVSETGTAKSIHIYLATALKNELNGLIKRRSYNLERTLGNGLYGDTQAEYLEGAIANELTVNIPSTDKINADLSFIACDNTVRTGNVGDKIKSGERIPALGESAFNTSSDVYRIKMSIHDPLTSEPTPLFAYVSEATVTINNNASAIKAVAVLGAMGVTVGNFDVGGSVTAYFTDVAAIRAIRNNADVAFNVIAASANSGFIYDIPLVSLGGGRLNVEKDSPITIPLETAGAENSAGYTMLYQTFPYLPNVAMPQ